MASIKTLTLPIFIVTLFPVSVLAQSESETPVKSARQLEEVIVTAARREQDIQDVVGGIEVFAGAALERDGADGFEDYVIKIPGVGFRKEGTGGTKLGMRGVSNISGNISGILDGSSTVGLYLNDVPMQGSSALPDLGLYDLNRVEALKGPQGTLYGEGSMGGAIKMILNSPSMVEYEAKAEYSVSETKRGGRNTSWKAAVGGPLWEDRIGARLVATSKDESGYIDYTSLNQEDANETSGDSFRALLNFQVTEKLYAELLYFNDESSSDAAANTQPENRDEYRNTQKEDDFYELDFNLTGLTIKYEFENIEFSSVTSFLETESDAIYPFRLTASTIDSSGGPTLRSLGFFIPPDTITGSDVSDEEPYRLGVTQEGIAQEFRLVSLGDHRLNWVAGVFFTERDQEYKSTLFMDPDLVTPIGLPIPGLTSTDTSDPRSLRRDGKQTTEQFAVYAEGIYKILPTLELTAGLRWFDETVSLYDEFEVYNIYAAVYEASQAPTLFITELEEANQGVLPKLSLAWYLNDANMVYGLVSRGFRSAGPNAQFQFGVGEPIIDPDYLWNYEIGTKTQWFEGLLTINGSLFFLDWTDFQAQRRGVGQLGALEVDTLYVDNIGDAEVKGAELQVVWLPFAGASTGFSVGLLDGEVVKTVEGSNALVGGRLPNMPEFSGNVFFSYTRPIFDSLNLTLSTSYQIVDEQGTIEVTDEDPDGLPTEPYDMWKASISIEGAHWGVTLSGDNLLDENVELQKYEPFKDDVLLTIGRPRTVGITVRIFF